MKSINFKKQKGFMLLETLLVLGVGMIITAFIIYSVVQKEREHRFEQQEQSLIDMYQRLDNITSASSNWIPPNSNTTNPFDILYNAGVLPYAFNSVYSSGKTTYGNFFGGNLTLTISGATNNLLNINLDGLSSEDCNKLADFLTFDGIENMTINGLTQTLGPTGILSARDPTSASFLTSCGNENSNSINVFYQKLKINIHSNIVDLDATDSSLIHPSGNSEAGVGVVSNGVGYQISGPYTLLDPGKYYLRIYVSNVQASMDISVHSLGNDGSDTLLLWETDATANPVRSSPGTPFNNSSLYVQNNGISISSLNTVLDKESFSAYFNIPNPVDKIDVRVYNTNGKPLNIEHISIYPVNPISNTIE